MLTMGFSINGGFPKENAGFITENTILMDDLGVHLFQETTIYLVTTSATLVVGLMY